MMLGALALGLAMIGGSQPMGGLRAGPDILRALQYLLRSFPVLPDPKASTDARFGRPVPYAATIPRDIFSKQGSLDPMMKQWSAGEPEEWSAWSARQYLPADRDGCCPSVASTAVRGGRSILLARYTPEAQTTLPVLDFPEPGLDDTAAYQGYQTRFYRDSKQNTVQIYLEPRGGRAVLVWADAANESVGFTLRDAEGRPARLAWGAEAAHVADSGATRTLEYRLRAEVSRLVLGFFLLGSMRIERDFVHAERHLQPFTAPPFRVREESLLVASVGRLPAGERRRHLALLNARSIAELRSRLQPTLVVSRADTTWTVRVERPSLDGRNRLALELRSDTRAVAMSSAGRTVSLRALGQSPLRFTVRVITDAAPLTPLGRDEIFNRSFLNFLAGARTATDSGAAVRSRRLERQVRAVELLSSKEKLMAGLPNFATYFGRDMMMTALMMRPIWSSAMPEHVIASVLRKLGAGAQVSHEEALGGQAIRENAVVYDSLVTAFFRAVGSKRPQRGDSLLGLARAVLRDVQATRENYHMVDDEFQLPILAAQYLTDSTVAADRKRAFLSDTGEGSASRLTLLLREMALVAAMTRPYAEAPLPTNLVSFPKRDPMHWRSASWRDSDAGYAGGRFAMDVNAIWAPHALEATGAILAVLPEIGISPATVDSATRGIEGTPLGNYARNPVALQRAISTWRTARRHFEVALGAREVQDQVRAKLTWLPEDERHFWQGVADAHQITDSLRFLALSLDSTGKPIPVVNTDPATGLFLEDQAGRLRTGARRPEAVVRDVAPFVLPYPFGLLVDSLGPLVANDAYASREIWERFRKDHYHGPRVVWGREVNLLLLGLANQISAAPDAAGRPLLVALRRTLTAVNASGLEHNELWSYRINDGRLLPIRYGTSSDVQLWNTTDLAVEFVLSRLPGLSQ